MNENLKIVIIGVYYGEFPKWMQYWLRSCADNSTIDFLLITDININDLPPNVSIIKMKFSELHELIEKKLDMHVVLEKPYKLCDYRPLYGILFQDYISDYDYWGHCDFDLIWGDIRYFIERYDIKIYDKFLPLGHLALYKNTTEVNNFYKLEGSKCGNYIEVLKSNDNFAFDETGGIYSIYEYNNIPMFTKRIFAEIKMFHKRFRLKHCDKNYKHQVFYYENGKIYRAYEKKGKINTEQYIYIHFRRKLPIKDSKKWNEITSFYITPNGFFPKENECIPNVKEIERYNHNPGFLFELFETILFCMKNITKIKIKIENEIITLKGNR